MLKLSNVSAATDGPPLFEDVSFVINPGERVGLVGPNGVGKSTLLRVAAGLHPAETGSVATAAGDRVGYLPQQPPRASQTAHQHLATALGDVSSLESELQALEGRLAAAPDDAAALARYGELQTRFEQAGGYEAHVAVDSALHRLDVAELDLQRPLQQLSGGEQARLMMAGVTVLEPTVLLLDEPTNHLDLDGVRWLERFLCTYPGAALVVSHDRRFLDDVVGRTFELDGVRPQLQVYEGGYTAYRDERERRWRQWEEAFQQQERERKRLEADIDRTKRQAQATESRTTDDHLRRLAAKVARKAKVRERRLRREALAAEHVSRPERRGSFDASLVGRSRSGKVLVGLHEVAVRRGEHVVLRDVDVTVRGRDRLAVVGPNGAGKSTLLTALEDAGRAQAVGSIGVLAQDHAGLPLEGPVLEFFRSRVRMGDDDAAQVLADFLFEHHVLRRPLGSLSAGERTRLLVATLVRSEAELLLLDEPTNHLDFDALEVVEGALRAFEGTLVVVSHDRAFLDAIEVTEALDVRDHGVRRCAWHPRPRDSPPERT